MYLDFMDQETQISTGHCRCIHLTVLTLHLLNDDLFYRAELESDPWSMLVKRFETIKDLCEAHHCKVLAVVVNDQMEELPADVLTTFKSRFSLDDKCDHFQKE